MRRYWVYMMTNKGHTVLYNGLTNHLPKRTKQHKEGKGGQFTRRYRCNKLVWYQQTTSIWEAIKMEKRMKKWKREYKVNLINKMNPEWRDLSEDFL
jgi:putative endonuclease